MRDYIIMTDSCCDLPAALVSELELTVLPLSFCIEGQELYNFPDNREMDPKVFYGKLRNGAEGTTSAINVGVFQTEMARIASEGRDILCISFSSGLSTTYQSAHCRKDGDGGVPGLRSHGGGQPGRLSGSGPAGVPGGPGEEEGPVYGGDSGVCGAGQKPHLPLVHSGRSQPPQAGRTGLRSGGVGGYHAADEAGAARG